jgi:flagellar biosynthesis/type III secretory pathway ATPase
VQIKIYLSVGNPEIDNALRYIKKMHIFLKQRTEENIGFNDAITRLKEIFMN